ncbi:MAG: hypothetical protein AB2A00_36405 [Myxococcota bacterium]
MQGLARALVLLVTTGCVRFVDGEDLLRGDPGSAAWDCSLPGEMTSCNVTCGQAYTEGVKLDCSDTWQCQQGSFRAQCRDQTWYFACECFENEVTTGTFNTGSWCDQDRPTRARRVNVGCGWKVPAK